MPIDLQQFHQAFFEEAAEHLATMESLLLELDTTDPEPETLNAIFRAAHSIKGSSGTFGFNDLQDLTHVLETLLDKVRKGELALRSEMVDAVLATNDVLKDMLAAHRGGPAAEESAITEARERLERLSVAPVALPDQSFGFFEPVVSSSGSGAEETAYGFFSDAPVAVPPPAPAPAEEAAYGFFSEVPAPAAEPVETAYGFFEGAPGTIPLAPTDSASIAEDAPYGFFVDIPVPDDARENAVADGHCDVKPLAEKKPTSSSMTVPSTGEKKPRERKPAAAATTGDTSIRVGIDKVDQLINLVGELVITQAMLAQSAQGIDPVAFERLHAGLAQLERNTRDLQESVMSIRMMPMSVVFSRFPRVVRDLSNKLGKQVELKTSGENTELDKGLTERITDPLTHLVRNSLDHGIEMPEERTAKGKPAVGTITLSAYHQSGNIVIEVGDDGAGLNRQKILSKAREKGLPVSDSMSDAEVWMLIFEAGFSTADQVTEVSGRGVGMDVVKRNITSMGGRVEIDSMQGVGTRMTVRLPLTLAILDGMSVSAGRDNYIIPLGYVIESLQVEKGMVKSVSGVERLLQVRGEYLPVVALHELFRIPGAISRLEDGIMVVVEADGTKAALFIDALVGQHQVVIKSLEANYRKVAGIAGATIMGDGHVALILDVAALVAMVRQTGTTPALPLAA